MKCMVVLPFLLLLALSKATSQNYLIFYSERNYEGDPVVVMNLEKDTCYNVPHELRQSVESIDRGPRIHTPIPKQILLTSFNQENCRGDYKFDMVPAKITAKRLFSVITSFRFG